MSSYSAIHTYPNVLPTGMVVIYDETLAADTASFDVQNIPAGYDHLQIVLSLRTTESVASSTAYIRFNGDSGSNYDRVLVRNTNASLVGANTLAGTSIVLLAAGASQSTGSVSQYLFVLPDYAGTTFHKGLICLMGHVDATAANAQIEGKIGRWRNTSAIDQITLTAGSGNFAAGSRLTIYGMGNADAIANGQIEIGVAGGIDTGIQTDFTVPYDLIVTGWKILADQTGSIVFDLWKDSYANFPPTVADSITASAKPTLTSANKASSTSLTGWTTSWTKDDIIRVNVDSVSTITRAVLILDYYKG